MSRVRIAVALSGGVDSSTAAVLLKEQGYDLVGFSMQLWDQRRSGTGGADAPSRCCSIDDLHDARTVAARLGFPCYVVNFEREFERSVVRSFVDAYRGGTTPSPCVLCNSRLKFDHLVRMADEVEATHVATGHYARVERDEATGRLVLRKGVDASRDQSYFLFGLSQEQLGRAMFPLGSRTKPDVRAIARRHGLEVADKPDSQEICFVPDGDYASFVERQAPGFGEGAALGSGGDIVDTSGRRLGRHRGIHRFTVGQRRGLGIAHTAPLYVIALEPETGRVIVGGREDLVRRRCRVVSPSWIAGPNAGAPRRVAVKIRSRHPEAAASLRSETDGSITVEFDVPQAAVAPGQAAVFYDGDVVLGGGWIARDPS